MDENNTVTIPREEYNILLMAQTRLDDLRLIVAGDKRQYGHYDGVTNDIIDTLLGVVREEKEKAD